QKKVELSEAKIKKLNAEIKDAEDKIDQQTGYLSGILTQMYAETDASPLEILAGSSSIGDFIAQKSYKESLRDQITRSLNEIKVLKKQLEEKKTEVEHVLADQK